MARRTRSVVGAAMIGDIPSSLHYNYQRSLNFAVSEYESAVAQAYFAWLGDVEVGCLRMYRAMAESGLLMPLLPERPRCEGQNWICRTVAEEVGSCSQSHSGTAAPSGLGWLGGQALEPRSGALGRCRA